MMSILHLAKNSSADGFNLDGIHHTCTNTKRCAVFWGRSSNNQTHSLQKAVKVAQSQLYRTVYQSHLCSALKLETLASYL